MSRRKEIKNKIKLYFNITEVFDKKIPTDYKIIDFGNYVAARFKTKSGNEYDLEFHFSTESGDVILNNKKTLKDAIKTNKEKIDVIDVAFTLSDIVDKDNPDEFELEINLNEQYELLARLSYIAEKLAAKYKKYKVFIIGGDARRNRLKMYKILINNLFSKYFDVYSGISEQHEGDSIFLIRKS